MTEGIDRVGCLAIFVVRRIHKPAGDAKGGSRGGIVRISITGIRNGVINLGPWKVFWLLALGVCFLCKIEPQRLLAKKEVKQHVRNIA